MKRTLACIATTLTFFCVSSSSFAGGGYKCDVEVEIKASQPKTKCQKQKKTGQVLCSQMITYKVSKVPKGQKKASQCKRQLTGKTYAATFQVPKAQGKALTPHTKLKATYNFFSLCKRPLTIITWDLHLPRGKHIRSQTRTSAKMRRHHAPKGTKKGVGL